MIPSLLKNKTQNNNQWHAVAYVISKWDSYKKNREASPKSLIAVCVSSKRGCRLWIIELTVEGSKSITDVCSMLKFVDILCKNVLLPMQTKQNVLSVADILFFLLTDTISYCLILIMNLWQIRARNLKFFKRNKFRNALRGRHCQSFNRTEPKTFNHKEILYLEYPKINYS